MKKDNFYPDLSTPTSTNQNIFSYLDTAINQKTVTSLPGCENVYDDNYRVRNLGYTNCQNAFADYLAKGLDVNSNYGQNESLADICPVSAKTPKYLECSNRLINKNTDLINSLNKVNQEMETSINQRIRDRISNVDSVFNDMAPFIFSNNNLEIVADAAMKNQIPQTRNDILPKVAQYYNDKYGDNIINVEGFAPDVSSVDAPATIEGQFFGDYRTIAGNYKNFENININIGFDENEYGVKTIKFIIYSLDVQINYDVSAVNYFNNFANVIKMTLSNKQIMRGSDADANKITNILKVLGISDPAFVIMAYSEFMSDAGLKRATYKIVNSNLDTIMVLEKV